MGICASQENDNELDMPSTTLERYDILRVLGKGSFGKVHAVRLKKSGDIYAMKLLDKNEIVKSNMIKNVMNERKLLSTLNHPLIVNLRYALQDEYNLYMVVDYMKGGDLRYHLRYEKKFSMERIKYYIAQIAIGLNYIHEHGYLHRDIKPDNLLLDEHGNCHITDFNLSKKLSSKGISGASGTRPYMAPEVIGKLTYGKEADWWSLGITAYELAFQILPFDSNGSDLVEEILNAKAKFPKDHGKDFSSLIKGLLKKKPERRFGFEDLKNHTFFKDIDWEELENMESTAPWVPEQNKLYCDGAFDLDEQFEVKKKKSPLDPEIDEEFSDWNWSYD